MTRHLIELLSASLPGQLPVSHPPPPLPSPPFLERMLFEQPFGLVAGFILLSVVLLYVLRRSGHARQGYQAAFLAVLLAVATWLTADKVHTPREQMASATASLVDATATVDEASLRRLLSETLRFYSRYSSPGPAIPRDGTDRETLIVVIRKYLKDLYSIKEHSAQEIQAVEDGPGMGRTQVRVRVLIEGIPNVSWWLIHWRRDDQGTWRATTIEPQDIPGMSMLP